MPLLQALGLRLYYQTPQGPVRAVDDASFSLDRGQALGVVGESGCGKTSLALALMRLLPRNTHTYEGSLLFQELDLMKLSKDDFRRKVRWKRMSMVFQGAMNSLNPVMKVGHQVAEPLLLDRSVKRSEAFSRTLTLLDKVGLPKGIFDLYPHELSGGMKQRVVIAMSLVLDPELVILDEPTSALDVIVQAQTINLLKGLKRELKLSFIFITHDIALASDLCDRIAVMYGGQMVESATAEDLFDSPAHPYSQGLLASIPRLRGSMEPGFILGAPPDLVAPPLGCRFHPRCRYALQICKLQDPPAVEAERAHTTRCWLRGSTDG